MNVPGEKSITGRRRNTGRLYTVLYSAKTPGVFSDKVPPVFLRVPRWANGLYYKHKEMKEGKVMYNPTEYARCVAEEERRLMREVSTGSLSWKKIGQMIRLNALLSMKNRPY
jgi:hypothetical protein